MSHPTPIADAVAECAAAVEAGGLLFSAAQLALAVHQIAKLERFHAELTAEAHQEELRNPGLMPTAHSDFLDHFSRTWGASRC